jgi:hypothetical protein
LATPKAPGKSFCMGAGEPTPIHIRGRGTAATRRHLARSPILLPKPLIRNGKKLLNF